VTIDTLPDLALLEKFNWYLFQVQAQREATNEDYSLEVNAWHALVHVCNRWRAIVFGSPRRLNLRLFCTDNTRVMGTQAVWPPLPIVLAQSLNQTLNLHNIIATLQYNERVCEIDLSGITNWELRNILAVTRVPFPALTDLVIGSEEQGDDEMPPVVPEWFLGGSAPRLRFLHLDGIQFPGLPNLLVSATGLVYLGLRNIADSGYISPQVAIACLSTLTRLRSLDLQFEEFETPLLHPHQDSRLELSPHSIRSVLPALRRFTFEGTSEYLECLLAWIDAPLLVRLEITFNNPPSDTSQLVQFVSRTPNIMALDKARMEFSGERFRFSLFREIRGPDPFSLTISSSDSNSQLSSLAEFCTNSLSFPSGFFRAVERVLITQADDPKLDWQDRDDIENRRWQEVLNSFIGVRSLNLSSSELVLRISPALQGLVWDNVTGVLPSLQHLIIENYPTRSVPEVIGEFIAARQLAWEILQKDDSDSPMLDD
jgi:hypothetical protein